MSEIKDCKYCGQGVLNKDSHEMCRIAHLEILIAWVQDLINARKVILPSDLQIAILMEDLRTRNQQDFNRQMEERRQQVITESATRLERLDKFRPIPDKTKV
ncbi:MAG TPA: hypothetical protein VJC04_01560 [Candidatus Paceibacterota bacterium]